MSVPGRARVLKETADGTETPLNRLVPGDECGESSLLEGGTHGTTVRASTTFLQVGASTPVVKSWDVVRITGVSVSTS